MTQKSEECLANELEKYRQMKSRINAILADANPTPASSTHLQKYPAGNIHHQTPS